MPENHPLQSLIAEILDAETRGEVIDRNDFLRQHPHHAESLREFFVNHDSMKSNSNGQDTTFSRLASAVTDATLPPTRVSDEDATLPPPDAETVNVAKVGDKIRYFGDYELLEEIARGGMGVVYKARQINLNRFVALKMILAGQLASQEEVKRFHTEAEAAANLDHPGIVPIFEIGEHQGQHYFSMGYIEGESLAHRVADGPLAPREAAQLIRQVCEAMAYAHERGVIHRDLKPANILIDPNGRPKVTDFGLAKQTEADSNLTGTGQILGTPSYMAPEQASGKVDDVGPLADVYAVGAILYCLLTGRPPFQAANPVDTLLQVLESEPVRPRELNSLVPKDLETICLKCLRKETHSRYDSMQDVAEELQRFGNNEPILARPLSRASRVLRWAKRKPALASMGFLLTLLVVGLAIGGPLVAFHQSALNQAAQQARRDRANAQLKSLLSASPASVPIIMAELQADMSELQPQILQLETNPNLTSEQRTRLRLLQYHFDPDQTAYLLGKLDDVEVDEFLLIRDSLNLISQSQIEELWDTAEDITNSDKIRFRSAAALAAFDPDSTRWHGIATEVVDYLVKQNSLLAGKWVEALRPARKYLLDSLEVVALDRSGESVAQSILATDILADYCSNLPHRVINLIEGSQPQQFRAFFPIIDNRRDAAIPLIEDRLEFYASLHGEGTRDPVAMANLGIALVRLDSTHNAWDLLKTSNDRSVRSHMISRFASCGVDWTDLAGKISQTSDSSIKQALILALGYYPNSASNDVGSSPLIEEIIQLGSNSDHAGVVAACEWLLQKRGVETDWLEEPTPVPSGTSRNWYVNSCKQRYVILKSGGCQIGSPNDEFGRRMDESQHKVLIDRTIAIAAKEVSVAEFQHFASTLANSNHTFSTQHSPTTDCPQTSVTWYEAAAYCNWLSQRDGIPQDEWCFIPNDAGDYADEMKLPPDYLERGGYRLPTELEWEYACRAGATTSRCFGNSQQLLDDYAWYLNNAEDRSWPIGSKLPNCWGLFDVHGNVWEWCANPNISYPPGEFSDVAIMDTGEVQDGEARALRGGSFFYHAIYTRCALRNKEPVDSRYFGIGFRPVRTLTSRKTTESF